MSEPKSTAASPERLHGLDALRAVMMLLGLLLHTLVSYGPHRPLGDTWPYLDEKTSVLSDLIVVYIHSFRMPLFFVMSGFFAAMLFERRGAASMLRNRFARIGIPFVVGMIVIYPMARSGFVFAPVAASASVASGLSTVREQMTAAPYENFNTIHLWFLYYLLYFYVMGLGCQRVAEMLPERFRAEGRRRFEALLRSPWRPLVLAVPSAVTLLPMTTPSFDTSVSLVPDAKTFAAYFIFFGFGWLLYGSRSLLETFVDRAWTLCILGSALFVPNFLAQRAIWAGSEHGAIARLVSSATGGLMAWLLIFGTTGLFLRYASKASTKMRYMVDASYWLYLLHLPIAIWVPGLISQWSVPALVKIVVVLAVMVPTLVVTYHLFVRPTIIGKVLNGRRYPAPIPFFGRGGS
ncbi:MAG: acyltransferase family protein [Myxococcota bacterium]